MPQKRKPSYLLHKPTGQARVRLDGKDIYLGEYGSPESRERYEQLVADWFVRSEDAVLVSMTVDDLAVLYLKHAEQHYRKNGKPTPEISCIRIALRVLIAEHGRTRAREFGPRALKTVRDAMIEKGYTRKSINVHVGRIRRMFKWAAENEYVDFRVFHALTAVSGLRAGRSAAKESDPVLPVSDDDIAAIAPYVSRQVWAMIQLQLLTGMRPGEALTMRAGEIDASSDVWEYAPASHKTEHHGRRRIIFLGPQAQQVLVPFMDRPDEAFLFSPAEARNEFDEERKRNRKTPMTPSQAARARKVAPERKPGDHYTVCSYRRAISAACERAFAMPDELKKIPPQLPKKERERLKAEASAWRKEHCWHPHQLRHNAATEIRRKFGIEAARTVLGHSSAAVTEIYAEMDLDTARSVIGQVG